MTSILACRGVVMIPVKVCVGGDVYVVGSGVCACVVEGVWRVFYVWWCVVACGGVRVVCSVCGVCGGEWCVCVGGGGGVGCFLRGVCGCVGVPGVGSVCRVCSVWYRVFYV